MVPYYRLVGAETGVSIDQGTLAQLEQGAAPRGACLPALRARAETGVRQAPG